MIILNVQFNAVYYEPASLDYELGKYLKEKYAELPWYEIDSHNRIEEMTAKENKDFPSMKRNLIIGVRKTHKYSDNHKISDYLVPYTSSGCTAMCLYCYLVCNYNKCAYLRLFVNREEMLGKLVRTSYKEATPKTFEIGSNSDLILENSITGNLEWTIEEWAKNGRGNITFPSKFDMVDPLLGLNHQGKSIFRMSVNPSEIIRKVEIGTSPLQDRVAAVNKMVEAGYPTGILIAPVIFVEGWEKLYEELITYLASALTEKAQKQLSIEVIFMTYSNIHRYINSEAFPNAIDLYNDQLMSGRARGKYGYKKELRDEAEMYLRQQLSDKLPYSHIVYVC